MDFICVYCMGVKWICGLTPCERKRASEEAQKAKANKVRSPRSEYRASRLCSTTNQKSLTRCQIR